MQTICHQGEFHGDLSLAFVRGCKRAPSQECIGYFSHSCRLSSPSCRKRHPFQAVSGPSGVSGKASACSETKESFALDMLETHASRARVALWSPCLRVALPCLRYKKGCDMV